MNLICLDYAGIKQLAKEVADKLVKEAYGSEDNIWIDEKEAMHLLRILQLFPIYVGIRK